MGKESSVPSFELNSSFSIPAVGLGTIAITESPEAVKAAILKALEAGYRHLDTASSYGTEKALGDALQDAFAAGVVKREDVFVTTKIHPNQLHLDNILPSLQESLSHLQLGYVDLYLIHFPLRFKPGVAFPPKGPDDYLPLDMKATWELMEKLVDLGLAKSIGVSNFNVKGLQELLAHAKIVPAVNQIELHPQWQQTDLTAYCKEKGIHVSAWSPLGAPQQPYGRDTVLNEPIIQQIAEKHGKSTAQICLRWIYELGASSLPKSYNEKRQIENLSIWDFSLTEEDCKKIRMIEQGPLLSSDNPIFSGADMKMLLEKVH